ncbi:hypothetical protein [Blastococcus sp. TF02A-35]|uniref:hypothetical protein n=1 Tax=Blastococcus sp. TF02A-35 TaxID=2559612 RepID=UPI0010743D74|nr:hypothetical protein [Blastococcus sp. TF02A_35]TFV46556.1 hypothetical protein E4P43_16270 [Blastococcus sp. TF02A_35]
MNDGSLDFLLQRVVSATEELADKYMHRPGMSGLDVAVQRGRDVGAGDVWGIYASLVSETGYMEAWEPVQRRAPDVQEWESIADPAYAIARIEAALQQWARSSSVK